VTLLFSLLAFGSSPPETANLRTCRLWTPAVAQAWPLVKAAARRHNVDDTLLLGIIQHESSFRPRLTSSAGARGLMQVMPLHAKGGEDLYDPDTNVEIGTRLLAWLLRRYGDTKLALAAYNRGHGYIDGRLKSLSAPVIPHWTTSAYVKPVLRYQSAFKRCLGRPEGPNVALLVAGVLGGLWLLNPRYWLKKLTGKRRRRRR